MCIHECEKGAWVYVCAQEDPSHMCMCTWRPEVNFRYLFKTGSVIAPKLTDGASRQTQGSSCSTSYGGTTRLCCHALARVGVLET